MTIHTHLDGSVESRGNRRLAELTPVSFREGNERLSEEIDAIVYGA
ncbi:MAG: hypothetical protein R3199_03955 [Gemmatimonadota bacterium]|nr:hypothetical protein [Gemmatimonadota bacterium]